MYAEPDSETLRCSQLPLPPTYSVRFLRVARHDDLDEDSCISTMSGPGRHLLELAGFEVLRARPEVEDATTDVVTSPWWLAAERRARAAAPAAVERVRRRTWDLRAILAPAGFMLLALVIAPAVGPAAAQHPAGTPGRVVAVHEAPTPAMVANARPARRAHPAASRGVKR